MKITNLALILLVALMAGCTKPEAIQEPAASDITGLWNAYGYIDFAGYVPLEIVEVSKTGTNEYTAIKVMGDNGVTSGEVSWKGTIQGNSGLIELKIGDGRGNYSYHEHPIEIKSNNIMEIPAYKLLFTRRVDGITP